MSGLLAVLWPYITSGSVLVLAAAASIHVLLNKREVRAAIGWVGIVWLVPVMGPVLYYFLGINRIRRRASRLRADALLYRTALLDGPKDGGQHRPTELERALPRGSGYLLVLRDLGDRLSGAPLVQGNAVTPLDGGDQAFPAMIEAIDTARRSIALSSYIFDYDPVGVQFADALERAHKRGVQVRVLIDGMGALYSWRSMFRSLVGRGVPVAKFLHSYIPWRMAYLNLRSHRKILVVDGTIGFTGGMNLRVGHCLSLRPKRPVRDIHFRFEGPVVSEMLDVFTEDWHFTTGEQLARDLWYPAAGQSRALVGGPVFARAVADGPDEDLERLTGLLFGALTQARRSVRLVTPYFLPDRVLIAALRQASLRGVKVQIVIPSASNLPFVDWAAWAQLWQLLEQGCEIWLSPAPFDHAKLLVVDGLWSLVGSSNWDQRSLRLNFEFNVECFDPGLGRALDDIIGRKIEAARQLGKQDIDGRGLPAKLRDGIAWLFSPYL